MDGIKIGMFEESFLLLIGRLGGVIFDCGWGWKWELPEKNMGALSFLGCCFGGFGVGFFILFHPIHRRNTIDGRNPANQLRLVNISHDLQG